ncbi:MAG: site-specific integrase [Firmicutes bacterium]|nr:site-specific integrase [Bacillota bacterium]
MFNERVTEEIFKSIQTVSDCVKQIDRAMCFLTSWFSTASEINNGTYYDNGPKITPIEESVQHINNLIEESKSKAESLRIQKLEEEKDLMRLNKGIRKRADGRFEWRQTTFKKNHYLIGSDLKELIKEVNKYKKEHLDPNSKKPEKLKAQTKINPPKEPQAKKNQEARKLCDLVQTYYVRHIESRIANGKLVSGSAGRYKALLKSNNYIGKLNKNIDCYTKDDLIDFFNEITAHRNGAHCFYLLRNVFLDEMEKGNIARNPMAYIKNPFPKSMCKKGTWLNIEEQKLIMNNLHKTNIGMEIQFYLLTGCRREEALKTTINFEKRIAYIAGTKTKGSARYVDLSPAYCEYLKSEWSKMFKFTTETYTRKCAEFFKEIGIKGKSLHSLRHTFATNLYYLGVPDKERQHLMGHASIVMTNDVYTTLDRSVKKEDIIEIYGELYPDFKN